MDADIGVKELGLLYMKVTDIIVNLHKNFPVSNKCVFC